MSLQWVVVCVPGQAPKTVDIAPVYYGAMHVRCRLPDATEGSTNLVQAHVLNPAEYAGMQQAVVSSGSGAWAELSSMSIENAQVISLAVCGVWAVAWSFKALRRAISNPNPEEE